MKRVIDKFINWNIRLSDRATPKLVSSTHAYTKYREVGDQLLREMTNSRVLDIGAGGIWWFPKGLKDRSNLYLIGFDIDDDRMRENRVLDEKISGDACLGLGVDDDSIDLITASAVLEHLYDTAAYIRNSYRALRPGGKLLVTFANKHAPFAILNRMLPRRVSSFLLSRLVPGSDGELGFKAYYDKCSWQAFKSELVRAGFTIDSAYCSYFSSAYFRFCLPIYLVSTCWDYIRYLFNVRSLASHSCVLATKPVTR